MENKRICLDCGQPLQGRSDKKFCDDQCRSNYNNKIYSEENVIVNQINSILRRNRKILQELNPSGKTKVLRKKLLAKGFSLDYFTNVYKTQTDKTYYFCYDYGYLILENEEILIVKKEDNY